MNLPRGNVLLKPTHLELDDLKIKIANLQHHGFNGYVLAELSGNSFYVFLKEGVICSVVEVAGKISTLISELLLYHRIKKSSCSLASYVLAPDLVDVLSRAYAYQSKYSSYQVKKKEFAKILSTLDSEKMTGVLEFQVAETRETAYFLLNQGRIVTDNFLDVYGQIITGPEKVSELIDKVSVEGGTITTFGETHEQIEKKSEEMREGLELYKELEVTVESSGFRFGASNVVRLDEGLLREWSKQGAIQKVEIFLGHGSSEVLKVSGKKGLGTKISITTAIQKKLGLSPSESVLVKPAM